MAGLSTNLPESGSDTADLLVTYTGPSPCGADCLPLSQGVCIYLPSPQLLTLVPAHLLVLTFISCFFSILTLPFLSRIPNPGSITYRRSHWTSEPVSSSVKWE